MVEVECANILYSRKSGHGSVISLCNLLWLRTSPLSGQAAIVSLLRHPSPPACHTRAAFCGTETLRCLALGTGRSMGGLSRVLNTPVQL
jgi:hypothetical protein